MTKAPERILVRGVNWLGDAVMTTPALLQLRAAFPNANITILTPEKLSGLWIDHPAVNDVIAFTPKESVWQVARRLRWGNFDIGLIFPNSPRSALELWLARIPRRVGYSRPWRNLFLTDAVHERPGKVHMHKRSVAEIQKLISQDPQVPAPRVRTLQNVEAHQVHDYLHLTATLGANRSPIAPEIHVSEAEVEALVTRLSLPHKALFLGLNAGAEYGPAKRWPADRFAAAAVEIQQRTNCHWLIFGGKSDVELAEAIAAQIRSRTATQAQSGVSILAGKTNLRELCVLLKACRVLLTNDTGPAHVAAAVGTPVIIPFGSTSPDLTCPGLPGDAAHAFIQSQAPCTPCFMRECPIDFRCMSSIPVKTVAQAVLAKIKICS